MRLRHSNWIRTEERRRQESALPVLDAREAPDFNRERRMKAGHIPNRPSLIEHWGYRFLIMDAPTDGNIGHYVDILKKHGAVAVARACEPSYSTQPVLDAGMRVVEMYYADGDPPPDAIIDSWLDLVESVFGPKAPAGGDTNKTIAVHCVAGLGRAPVLVAIALMEGGVDAYDAIELIRQKRRGAINARQLKFIESYRPRRHFNSGCNCTIL